MAGCPLCFCITVVFAVSTVSAANQTSDDGQPVEFLPARMDGLVLGKTDTVDVKTTTSMTDCLRVSCVVVSPGVVELVHGGNVTVCAGVPSNTSLPHLTVRGLRMGRTSLDCRVEDSANNLHNETLLDKYHIAVIRKPKMIDMVFFVSLNLLVVCSNIGMGCAVDLDVVKSVLRRPVAPAIGFFSQFVIMPLLAYIIVRIFGFTHKMAIGYFILGCSPGGGHSNIFTLLLRGDVSLSVTMTLISNTACLAFTPLWLLTLGQSLLDDDTDIVLPFGRIALSLLVVFVPLVVGVLVARFKPRIAAAIRKGLRPFFIVTLVYITALFLYVYSYIFNMLTVAIVLAGCCLPYVGFLIGAILSAVFCQARAKVFTIAIETGIQNTGITFIVLTNSLPHPELEIAMMGPAVASIVTPLPLLVAVAVQEIRQRWCCRRTEVTMEETAEAEGETKGEVPRL